MELHSKGDEVTLRPVRSHSPLQKKQGIWIFKSGAKLSNEEVNTAVGDIRQRRDRSQFGPKR
jgi:hypothetical protein